MEKNNTTDNDGFLPGEKRIPYERIPVHVRYMANISFLVAETLDSMLIDAHDEVTKVGFHFKHRAKQCWTRLNRAIATARLAAKDLAIDVHLNKEADMTCDDADYLADIIYLIADRVGDDPEAYTRIRSLIYNLPSKCHFYDTIQKLKNHEEI